MDRRTVITVVICFLIFLGWQKLYVEPRYVAPGHVTQGQSPAGSNPAAMAVGGASAISAGAGTATVTAAKQERRPEERRTIQTGTGSLQVTNGERFFAAWDLKNYRLGLAQDSAHVDLKSVTHQSQGQGELGFDSPEFAYLSTVQGSLSEVPGGVRWTYEDQNVKMVRTMLGALDRNYVDLGISLEFKSRRPNFAFVSLSQTGKKDDDEARDRRLLYWTKKSVEKVNVEESIGLSDVASPTKWIGVSSRYFLMSFVSPDGQTEPKGLVQPVGPWTGRISMVYPLAGNSLTIPLRVYFGPKELSALRSVEPTLDHTVDFGIFTIIAYPLLNLLRGLFGVFHNYGIAIILLTILVRMLVYPLTFKSMKSMKEMARLQPQLQKIKEKYADDREALNREMMLLMRTHGYNPMAGCLPILVQMPVFFALYNVLYNAIELLHAPFGLWIHDLSTKDPWYITPILLSGTMFLQQKLQPSTAADPMQQKMMQFMPIMFGVFMLNLPSGLTIYMLVSAVVGILQQLVINKKLGGAGVAAQVVPGR